MLKHPAHIRMHTRKPNLLQVLSCPKEMVWAGLIYEVFHVGASLLVYGYSVTNHLNVWQLARVRPPELTPQITCCLDRVPQPQEMHPDMILAVLSHVPPMDTCIFAEHPPVPLTLLLLGILAHGIRH